MPLIVEDGSGVENANGYTTAAEVRAYWEARATVIEEDDIELEAAIIIATQYVDQNNRFIGAKIDAHQALEWPRKCAGPYHAASIPTPLVKAVCEYAMRQLSAELQPDTGGQGAVISTVEKLDGVGTLETEYAEGTTRAGDMLAYPKADKYLDPLIRVGSMLYLRR